MSGLPEGFVVDGLPDGFVVDQKKRVDAGTLPWGTIPGEAVRRLADVPGRVGDFVKGIGGAIGSYIDDPTIMAKGLVDIVGGAYSVATDPRREANRRHFTTFGQDRVVTPFQSAELDKKQATVNAIAKALSDHALEYTTEEGLKRRAVDPLGTAMDAATVLSGGSLAMAKAPGLAGTVGRSMGTLAPYVDPVSLTGKALVRVRNGVGHALALESGLATGVGMKNVETAFEAGEKGGAAAKKFQGHLRRDLPVKDMVDEGVIGVGVLRQLADADYQHQIGPLRADPTILGMGGIDTALNRAVGSVHSPAGIPNISAAELADIQRTASAVDARRGVPFSVAEAIDLGKAVRKEYPSSPLHKDAKRVNVEVQRASDATINAYNPEYGKINKGYTTKQNLIEEIEHELSVPAEKMRVGVAARKLGQAFSGNAITANKAELVKALTEAGAENLPYAIAGQAMQPWYPRGIARLTSGLGAAGGAAAVATGHLSLPAVAAALASSSPRLVGEGAYYGGRVLGGTRKAGTAIGLTGDRARIASEIAYQLNRGESNEP